MRGEASWFCVELTGFFPRQRQPRKISSRAKDHGLLVCEVHVLRQLAHGLLPGDVEAAFLEDVDDLANLKGIPIQRLALERIRYTYAEWLNRN